MTWTEAGNLEKSILIAISQDMPTFSHLLTKNFQQQSRRNRDMQPESTYKYCDHGDDDDDQDTSSFLRLFSHNQLDPLAALGNDRSQHDEQQIYQSLAPNSAVGHDESLLWTFGNHRAPVPPLRSCEEKRVCQALEGVLQGHDDCPYDAYTAPMSCTVISRKGLVSIIEEVLTIICNDDFGET